MILVLFLILIVLFIWLMTTFGNWIKRTAGPAAEDAFDMGLMLAAMWFSDGLFWNLLFFVFFLVAVARFRTRVHA